MQDGKYQVTMNSPMGEKKGVVEIQPETGCIVFISWAAPICFTVVLHPNIPLKPLEH